MRCCVLGTWWETLGSARRCLETFLELFYGNSFPFVNAVTTGRKPAANTERSLYWMSLSLCFFCSFGTVKGDSKKMRKRRKKNNARGRDKMTERENEHLPKHKTTYRSTLSRNFLSTLRPRCLLSSSFTPLDRQLRFFPNSSYRNTPGRKSGDSLRQLGKTDRRLPLKKNRGDYLKRAREQERNLSKRESSS